MLTEFNDTTNLRENQAVFSLFIKELRGLENTTDKSFTLRYYLLENLEAVKAFNLLIDLNNDLLFVELFKTFFECITYVCQRRYKQLIT